MGISNRRSWFSLVSRRVPNRWRACLLHKVEEGILKKSFWSLLIISVLILATQSTVAAQAHLQAAVPGAWQIELVDRAPGNEDNPGILRYPSLAIDSNRVPQVMYSAGLEENTSNPLVYARKDGLSWVTQTVETAGEKPSLALSSQQQPRVAFFDFAANETLVFRNLDIAGGFRSVITTTIGSIQATTDLALSSNDAPTIAFTQKTEGDNFGLMLATQNGMSWTIELVFDEVGSIASLALDSANQVHLSYQDATSRTVKYATRAPTGWLTETVGDPDTLNLAIPNSIAVDEAATPHMVYVSFLQQALVYAKRTNNAWVKEKIANANLDFSFVLDKDGNPHVAYIEPFTRKPIYAVRITNTWITATASTDAAAYISLALDPSGQPAIAYTEFDTGNLKLARLFRGLVYLPLVRKP